MRLFVYDIKPELRPYIKTICSIECVEKCEVAPFRILPDTCTELFISYTDKPLAYITKDLTEIRARSFVTFRMTQFLDVQMLPGTGCLAICFYPETAYKFFPIPLNEVCNSVTHIGDLWKDIADEIEEKLSILSSNEARAAVAQQYLIQRLQKYSKADGLFEHCLQQIKNSEGQLSINNISRKNNISQRQLSRKFNDFIGLSPKEFAKINRFIHSLEYLKENRSKTLTDTAYENGYYDQAHFIHDCKKYSGLTPKQLLSNHRKILF